VKGGKDRGLQKAAESGYAVWGFNFV
jgi:hypothetical protein